MKKIEINKILYFYIIYILFLVLTDIGAFALYLFDANQHLKIVILTALIFTAVLVKLFNNRFTFVSLNLDKLFIVLTFSILAIGFFRGIIPDISADVANARVYWQIPGFEDNINYNAFAAGFTYFFPLGDRLFYYPQMILGYRMGTLLNTFVLILIFIQVRSILFKISEKEMERQKQDEKKSRHKIPKNNSKEKYIITIFAYFATMLFFAIADLGSYMIDIVAIPLLIWLIEKIFVTSKKDAFELIFTAFIYGTVFAFKLTNIIFIAPLLIYYLWQNRNSLDFKRFVLCMVVGIMPSVCYLLYSYISTGNPVYFTYNQIFKSPYYEDVNFRDMRWGPHTIWEILIWPIRMVIYPKDRIAEISTYPQIYVLIGEVCSVLFIFLGCKKKEFRSSNLKVVLSVYYLIILFLWLMSTGYPRYSIIIEILAVILLYLLFIEASKNHRKKFVYSVTMCMTCLIFVQGSVNIYKGATNEYDWSWRGTLNEFSLGTYEENIKYVFSDRGQIGSSEQQDKIDIFLTSNNQGSIAKLLNPEVPIINFRYLNDFIPSVKGVDYKDNYLNEVKTNFYKGKRIFDLFPVFDYDKVVKNANEIGAEILNLELVEGYFIGNRTPILVEYGFDKNHNTSVSLMQSQRFKIDASKKKEVQISGLLCVPLYKWWDGPEALIKVTATDDKKTVDLYEMNVSSKNIYKIDEVLDLSEFGDEVTISVFEHESTAWDVQAINLAIE